MNINVTCFKCTKNNSLKVLQNNTKYSTELAKNIKQGSLTNIKHIKTNKLMAPIYGICLYKHKFGSKAREVHTSKNKVWPQILIAKLVVYTNNIIKINLTELNYKATKTNWTLFRNYNNDNDSCQSYRLNIEFRGLICTPRSHLYLRTSV